MTAHAKDRVGGRVRGHAELDAAADGGPVISKLGRDSLLAEIETIQTMLGEIPEDELANRMSLESRRDELSAALAAQEPGRGCISSEIP